MLTAKNRALFDISFVFDEPVHAAKSALCELFLNVVSAVRSVSYKESPCVSIQGSEELPREI